MRIFLVAFDCEPKGSTLGIGFVNPGSRPIYGEYLYFQIEVSFNDTSLLRELFKLLQIL